MIISHAVSHPRNRAKGRPPVRRGCSAGGRPSEGATKSVTGDADTRSCRSEFCRVPRDLPERIHQQRRDLGDRIRVLRRRAGYTQEVIAEMTGIDRRTYQRIERGESDPRFSDLVLIAEAVGVTVSGLIQA
ncbi:helix-turn-helix transcriptional regulator [Streptomyces sp. NPDC051657]|uniref:helix-turn-helix domain-containing protein n=1 Tax=unclassified Streptomyces TaxID=2593676 RepID=UPI00342727C8